MHLENQKTFTAHQMISLFEALGEKLKERDQYLDIAIFGGSAIMANRMIDPILNMALMGVDRLTSDVDYIPIKSKRDLQDLMDETSEALGFSERVFRKDIEIFIGKEIKQEGALLLFSTYPPNEQNLRIYSASPQYLAAMKTMALGSRSAERDYEDLYHLIKACDFKSSEEVIENLSSFYPNDKLDRRAKLLVEDVFNLSQKTERFSMGDLYSISY